MTSDHPEPVIDGAVVGGGKVHGAAESCASSRVEEATDSKEPVLFVNPAGEPAGRDIHINAWVISGRKRHKEEDKDADFGCQHVERRFNLTALKNLALRSLFYMLKCN